MTEHYGPSWTPQERMVNRVAKALEELAPKVAFVGGCATALLVTDEFTRGDIRFTDDVDVIVQVIGRGQWYDLEERLRALGFRSSPEDDVICRKRLRDDEQGELIVDFMPDDEEILGFANRWYGEALRTALDYHLPNGRSVRVVSAPYFLGTKLEAYSDRGNKNPLHSRDIEDIINLVDGRPALSDELQDAPVALREYVATELNRLLAHRDFEYAVQGNVRGNRPRELLIFQRIEGLIALGRGDLRGTDLVMT